MLQLHPDNETDLVPFLSDDETRNLLVELDMHARQKRWCRFKMFSDLKNGSKLGLFAWLWSVRDEIRVQRASGWANLSTGSVLFVHIPHWVMPEQEVLQELQSMQGEGSITAPKWFPSVHATCENFGAHHFVVCTGELVIVGVFNADFTDISFTNPERIDVGRNGYGTGIGADGLERVPCEKLNTCLVQVISQVMLDAAESFNATSPQLDTPSASAFKFNVASLARNNHPAVPSNEPAEAMRFSLRTVGPSQEEMDAIRAYQKDHAKKGKGKAVIATAQESTLMLPGMLVAYPFVVAHRSNNISLYTILQLSLSRRVLSPPCQVRLLGSGNVQRIKN
ncbi:hypothetical protein FRB94_005955 [Tulasnella sp. JGI-2019a]|nr:hypothetical protein FRB94_005955 [Tulasnella sp. JGI-2019a]